MPFNPANLTTVVQTSAFSLWHYLTADARATVAASGYFSSVRTILKPGDLMILQTSDAMALLPLRSNAVLGTGVTLDGPVGPVTLVRTSQPGFSFRQLASAVVRSIVLAPLAVGIVAGSSIPVSATVIGPVSQVVFTLRDRTGAVAPPAQVVAVSGSLATASFAIPPVGTGYRIRVEDATDPNLAAVSLSFNVSQVQGVGADLRLMLTESGGHLLAESGGTLTQ